MEPRTLRLQSIGVDLGDRCVLNGIDLDVAPGTALAVLGASGSGKTTLLRTIVGVQAASRGRILVGGEDLTATPANARGMALVPQQAVLDPGRSLVGNVELPLVFRATEAPTDRRRRAGRELKRFGIGRLGSRRPAETSAGEQQTASTAKAMVKETDIILFDEPVIALDPTARRSMITNLRHRQMSEGITMIVATNDWDVAAGLADEMVVLVDGAIAQRGPTLDIYDRPLTVEVAELTGRWRMNRLAGTLSSLPGERTVIATAAGDLHTWQTIGQRSVIVAIRPEDLVVGDPLNQAATLSATVRSSMMLGPTTLVDLDADGLPLQATGPVPAPPVDTTVALTWRLAHLFDLEGRALARVEPS